MDLVEDMILRQYERAGGLYGLAARLVRAEEEEKEAKRENGLYKRWNEDHGLCGEATRRQRRNERMATRLKDLVRHEGLVTTIDALDKKGLIEYHEVKNFWSGRKLTTKYFADIKGTTEGWDIGKLAFLSRTERVKIKELFPEPERVGKKETYEKQK